MSRGLIIHAITACLWLFLQQGGVSSLITGLVFGFLLLALLRDLLGVGDYVRRVLGFFVFCGVFTRELVLANLILARAVLFRPLRDIRAGFITVPVAGLRPLEIYLLAQCITLTPGTTTVEVAEDGTELLIHAFDATDPQAVRDGIDRTLKKAILGFTR
jgi:multicomponent Na+:H+ antiporter subunit E